MTVEDILVESFSPSETAYKNVTSEKTKPDTRPQVAPKGRKVKAL